jgi:UDP-glucose 4-epimerase
MKFLVTGGCGFIGSHLCDDLLRLGHQVRIFDNMSTGQLSNKPAGAELIEGDIRDRIALGRALADVDGCFHLAAVASVAESNRNWIETHEINQTATIALFDLARATANACYPKPIVYASSAAVYGDHGSRPITERASAEPLSAYGADKLGCDHHARVARHVHGVPVTGLRFFNVYGPRQRPESPYSGVISIFCDRLAAGESVTIFGDGHQTRDFIYVSDVANALILAMDRVSTSVLMDRSSVDPLVLNICTGRQTSIRALATLISQLLGKIPRWSYQPERPGEIRTSVGDPTKAREVLGFSANTPLESGLAATLQSVMRDEPALT